ncbi:MAG: aldo/keto reductase [Gammaproteobacteria bacterium]
MATRRELLQATAYSAALGLVPGTRAFAEALRTRPIPSTGEALPVVGLGTSRVFDVDIDAEPAELAACRDVLNALVESGATVVDSSPMYGKAEAVSGVVAADLGVTDRVFWATKVWTNGRDKGIEQMQASMQLFGTEQIDLMQVHNLRDWREHMPVLREWKQEGRIRYIGITHSRAKAFDQVEAVINETDLDFVQLNYSLAERDAEKRLLPLCADQGIATLINRPFARGALFRQVGDRDLPAWTTEIGVESWAQFFLKFVLSHSAVTCAIPATRKADHMLDNVAAGFGPLPDDAQRRAMIDLIDAA